MRAPQLIDFSPPPPADRAPRDPSLAVLSEVIAGLAERVELLEAREELRGATLRQAESRRRKRP